MDNRSKFFDILEEDLSFNFDKEKKRLIDNLNKLKEFSVEEFTLYKKYEECIELKYRANSAFKTKLNIWTPKNIFDKEQTINEIQQLQPELIFADSDNDVEDWTNLRLFCHTMPFDMAPGRNIKITVIDKITNKFLGIINLSSDVTSINSRDIDIGWTKYDKFELGKLRNTAIASCIMSTQPFGYNFLGGKLIASLLISSKVRDEWKKRYGDCLVGITTTSLYGQSSMYNAIPYWKGLGESTGKIYLKPDDEFYQIWHQWLKKNKAEEYERITTRNDDKDIPVTGIKQRILYMIFSVNGIKPSDYVHGFKRGVYFMPFYENYKEFLTNKIQENELILKKNIAEDSVGAINWWRKKALKRYETVFNENRLKPEILYYTKMMDMTWEEARETYLKEVGR